MSSIRSLATITLLAGIGIVLYMKINEVEPVLPPEVADFEIGNIQFDEQPSAAGGASQFAAAPADSAAPSFDSAPKFGVSPPGEQAPAFNPNPASSTATASAPAWSEAQATVSPPDASVAAEAAPQYAPTADTSNLPPLPAIPPAVSASGSDIPPTDVESAGVESTSDTSTLGQTQDLSPPPAMSEFAPPTTPDYSPTAEVSPQQAETTPGRTAADTQASLFSATRLAVEAALDRGELSQALLLLSDWYDDPSLSAEEAQEVNELLRQLAGTVIYSTEHRLEPPYMVQAGEQLADIAQKYQVPWQLLAKINGIAPGEQPQPGQHLKVVRGPFSALIDLGRRKMTLMLDRRYAGQFALEVDPGITVEAGHWTVNQKLLTPGNVGFGASSGIATEEPSLMLSNPDSSTNQLAILRGSSSSASNSAEPAGRVIRLNSQEVGDVYDILSLGSRVVIRR
ncbi:MAG: LysM peptidoglycan-binding domain-containing protein [Planctomycetales bacterium]|nr:LysM peptidoglycan-binding domain-containing protein [Planctomycetales bacterium]